MVSEKRSIPCRMLLCLLVCLVLFWAIVPPLNASATEVVAAAASVVGITPAAAVIGILACFGLYYLGSTGVLDDLVDSIVDSLSGDYLTTFNNEVLVEGLQYNDTVYVPEDLVHDVVSSLTVLELSSAFTLPVEAAPFMQVLVESSFFSTAQPYFSDYSNASYFSFSDGTYMLILTNSAVSYSNSSSACSITFELPCIRFVGWDIEYSYPGYSGGISGGREMSMSGATYRTLNVDSTVVSVITVGITDALFTPYFEAAPDLDDDEEYQAWKARRLFRVIEGGDGGEDPDDDDDDDGLRVLAPYYPVPGAENVENLPDSQEQAWAGNRQEDPEDDPVTDLNQSAEFTTDPNYDPNTDSNPDTNPDSSPNPDPDSNPAPDPDPEPSPDTELSSGVLDPFNLSYLRNFFPFCIPFDLYDMLAAFVAEPEAPVFTFATGFLGNVYTVDIDLSPWNSIAKTVRAIQLCICIVGLAFATRKFIKW